MRSYLEHFGTPESSKSHGSCFNFNGLQKKYTTGPNGCCIVTSVSKKPSSGFPSRISETAPSPRTEEDAETSRMVGGSQWYLAIREGIVVVGGSVVSLESKLHIEVDVSGGDFNRFLGILLTEKKLL